MTLKVLSYNIRYGGSGRSDKLAAMIAQATPDIVIFQEATNPNVIRELAEELDMEIWASRSGYSLAFMSRIEIEHYTWHRPFGARHPYIDIVPVGLDMHLIGLHLSAIHSNLTEARRYRELNAILNDIEKYRDQFHIITGDFNTLAPGEVLDINRLPLRLKTFLWLTGSKIRWKTIQMMLDHGYIDGYRTLHPHEKGYTFPTWDAHLRLDYLFMPEKFANRLMACEVNYGNSETAPASDHFPLIAQLEAA